MSEFLNGVNQNSVSFLDQKILKASFCLNSLSAPGRNKVKQQSFWSSDIQELKAEARAAYKQFKRTNLLSTWEAYLDKKRIFKKELRKAKTENWRKFTASCEGP